MCGLTARREIESRVPHVGTRMGQPRCRLPATDCMLKSMKYRYLTSAAVAALFCVAMPVGVASANTGLNDVQVGEAIPLRDSIPAPEYSALLGKRFVFEGEQDPYWLPSWTLVHKEDLPPVSRVYARGDMITEDYRPDRLNVVLLSREIPIITRVYWG